MAKLKEYIKSVLYEKTMNELDMVKITAKQEGWTLERGAKKENGREIFFKKGAASILAYWNPKLEKFVGRMYFSYKNYSNDIEVSAHNLIKFLNS
jgi:hypothetical protein